MPLVCALGAWRSPGCGLQHNYYAQCAYMPCIVALVISDLEVSDLVETEKMC